MDLNGDNRLDIICGGAEGYIYSMTALENGQFTKPQRLKDKSGKNIHLGDFYNEKLKKWDKDGGFKNRDVCLYPIAVDWDNDGDLDIMQNGHEGLIAVRINEGTPHKAKYAEKNTYIMIYGKALYTGKGNTRFVDWDGDGLRDLICGVDKAGVIWLKNNGTKEKPSFAPPKIIISTLKGNDGSPNSHITVEVVDLNNDGKKDLLVGAASRSKKNKIWLYYQK